MARAQRTKLALKDLGDPTMVKTLPEGQRVKPGYFMGTIIGIASGFVNRKNEKTGEAMEGLGGTFRFIPSTEDRDELESGILWIPDAFHNMIAEQLRGAQMRDENAKLNFAFEVKSIGAQNPAGYSWEFTPKFENRADNPLDELMASVGEIKVVAGKRMLALAAPEAPKIAAGAGKK